VERRTLGDTDLSVSRVALGTMTFGAQTDEPAAVAMIDECLDRGIDLIDTANVYNAGAAEQILGKALKGRRDRVILASKVGIRTGDGPTKAGLSSAAIRGGIEASLRRLETDYLDLYYLHQPDPATHLEESLEAMDRLVREGKVRFLGASNYASWQVCRMLWLAQQNGWHPVRVVQSPYNLIARGIEPELLPLCREFSLATVVYNPLAGGLLTGKHRIGVPEPGTRFDRMPVYRDRYWNPANFEAVGQLAALAGAEGRSLAGLALAWLLHHTAADCLTLGVSRAEQLEENLSAVAQGPLSRETVEACDLIWKAVRGVAPRYHR
jgi:aryl-alcohol dehydrogenase-like predicted oxidoreductase